MQPPTTFYPHGYSDTSMEAVPVSNPAFYCPSWNGRWKLVTVYTMPDTVPPLIPLEAEYGECRTPKFPGLGLIHSSSTRPRPRLDQPSVNKGTRHACHRIRGLFTVSSSTSPWCPGMAGHSRSTSLQRLPQRSTNFTSKASLTSLPPLDPIKEKAGDSTKGKKEKQGETSHHPTIEDQHLKQSLLYSLSETWDRLPLSQLVTPTKTLRCKEIQYFPPLDVGSSFAWTRINPRVFSLHHHPDWGHAAQTHSLA
jgi:hypothetical protein